jgi:hypothetical protein
MPVWGLHVPHTVILKVVAIVGPFTRRLWGRAKPPHNTGTSNGTTYGIAAVCERCVWHCVRE